MRAPISASWGPRISAIIVASNEGIQLCRTLEETVNGTRFVTFVRDQLVPILRPYKCQNPNSISRYQNEREAGSESIAQRLLGSFGGTREATCCTITIVVYLGAQTASEMPQILNFIGFQKISS